MMMLAYFACFALGWVASHAYYGWRSRRLFRRYKDTAVAYLVDEEMVDEEMGDEEMGDDMNAAPR